MGIRRVTLRVQPPAPFGEVTLVPALLSGRAEADMARAMASSRPDIEMPTAADVLNRLQQAVSRAPLTAPFAVLAATMYRFWKSECCLYRPR